MSNDKDVQSSIDDCTGKRRNFIVGGVCIEAADRQRMIVGDAGAKTSAAVCLEQTLRTTPLTSRLPQPMAKIVFLTNHEGLTS